MEQRALVKRYLQFAAFFVVFGVAFSVFLIVSGNSGGWSLLAIIGGMSAGGYYFVQKGRGGRP